jgi:hypothetical protein
MEVPGVHVIVATTRGLQSHSESTGYKFASSKTLHGLHIRRMSLSLSNNIIILALHSYHPHRCTVLVSLVLWALHSPFTLHSHITVQP